MKSTSGDDELVLIFLKKEKEEEEILGLSNSPEKAAAGRVSRFDPGAEAV